MKKLILFALVSFVASCNGGRKAPPPVSATSVADNHPCTNVCPDGYIRLGNCTCILP